MTAYRHRSIRAPRRGSTPAAAPGADTKPVGSPAEDDITHLQDLRSSQLARGLMVLESLAEGPKTAADVARLIGVNRSTALRLLQELKWVGYVTRNQETKQYTTVPGRIWPLLAHNPDHLDWGELIEPILRSLRDELGEASLLATPANGVMVYLAFFPSAHPVTVRERLGAVRPMYSSAIGKAYMAALDHDAAVAQTERIPYEGGTRKAPQSPAELLGRLAEVRRRGYAFDQDETYDGASCVAAPIIIGRAAVGAAGVSGPSIRLPEEKLHAIGRRLVEDLDHVRRQL